MAHLYGKLFVKAWSSDFVKLPARAQRMYMFLISQPDISNAGIVTLAMRRWANCVCDEDVNDITEDLKALSASGYVVVDEDCEELLVRTYIRWDGGWKSPNMMKSIVGAASQALSGTIRAVIRDEVDRLDTSDLPTKFNEKYGRTTKDCIEEMISDMHKKLQDEVKDPEIMSWGVGTVAGVGEETHQVTLPERVTETLPVSNPSGNPSPNPLAKGSITTTTITTTNTTTNTTTTAKNAEHRKYTDEFNRFWNTYPKERRKEKPKAFSEWKLAIKRDTPENIIAGLERYCQGDTTWAPYPAKWLKNDRWQDGPDESHQMEAARSNPAMVRREENMASLQAYINQRRGQGQASQAAQGRLIGGAA